MKKDWTPTQSAFRQFLHWMDEGVDSDGERYLELRRRLVLYFDRKNCLNADDLADETLNRVAQKFQERGEITNISPAQYCYVVAKFVFLEYLRRVEHSHTSIDDGPNPTGAPQPDKSTESRDRMLDCLDRCLKNLSQADRELILEYYVGEQQEKIQRRRKIASALGLSTNALSIRACRIRARLETCVRSCCEQL
ncbi:MAG TPA: sigma-70 family RNA polymerase sigma factor [Candidatus Angelobacter sp.]|nr:sigma-70 family RNA polymerase sigma factor [Candidatus Angelobacter sp.]